MRVPLAKTKANEPDSPDQFHYSGDRVSPLSFTSRVECINWEGWREARNSHYLGASELYLAPI